jgi:hypothetical protein
MPAKKTQTDPLLEDEETKTPKSESSNSGAGDAITAKPVKTTPSAEQAKVNDVVKQTKEILSKSPHVQFIIPKTDTEPANSAETVQINGYRLTIQKGVMVNIPIQVANLLAEKYKINMTAGQEKRIDRDAEHQKALS